MEPFEASLPPDLARLRGLRRELAEWLDSICVDSDRRDAVVLAVHEAAANGIEHANGRVTVRGTRDEDKLLLVVTNSGRWRGPRPSESHRGRGLALMRALLSRMEIRVDADGTTVRMRMDLLGGESSAPSDVPADQPLSRGHGRGYSSSTAV
jgi:anti-sigma regulatory factor (Ser/Thr protein kinase)